MAVVRAGSQPRRPARWLYGEGIGVQVWQTTMTDSTEAALVLGEGPPLVLLSDAVVGTKREWPALAWALRHVVRPMAPGIYLRLM